MIIPLAKEFPQHEFYGYDWDVVPFSIASFRARRIKNVQLFCTDYTKIKYDNADVILIFGGKKLFANWGDKLVNGLKDGAILIELIKKGLQNKNKNLNTRGKMLMYWMSGREAECARLEIVYTG